MLLRNKQTGRAARLTIPEADAEDLTVHEQNRAPRIIKADKLFDLYRIDCNSGTSYSKSPIKEPPFKVLRVDKKHNYRGNAVILYPRSVPYGR